jgi:hypothetical protein
VPGPFHLFDGDGPVLAVIIVPVIGAVFKAEVHFTVALNFGAAAKSALSGLRHINILNAAPAVKAAVCPDRVGAALGKQAAVLNPYLFSFGRGTRFQGNSVIMMHSIHLLVYYLTIFSPFGFKYYPGFAERTFIADDEKDIT